MTIIKGMLKCTHKILLQDYYNNSIEQQRILDPIIKEVAKKEVIKWLDAIIIYLISDSLWVGPVQCVLKKDRVTIVTYKKNELIPLRKITELRVCLNYKKLNKATRKDHFLLYFID